MLNSAPGEECCALFTNTWFKVLPSNDDHLGEKVNGVRRRIPFHQPPEHEDWRKGIRELHEFQARNDCFLVGHVVRDDGGIWDEFSMPANPRLSMVQSGTEGCGCCQGKNLRKPREGREALVCPVPRLLETGLFKWALGECELQK